jgi:thiol-disulfide isomerase/thioredoxin
MGGQFNQFRIILRNQYEKDVWATWCAPCKQELPHPAKVEDDYKEQNIQFIGLSVDAPSGRKKWQEFIRTNRLKGLQLMTENAFESVFIQKLNINSIPRFILIDPDGKIISADAKRPSDPGLRTQLDALLAAK